MATHSSTLAWRIPGQRSLVGCSPWGREESDTTERLHFHFSLSYIGERNGNPLQCSCLENPRDGGAWWAAIYGVTQSRTRLRWLSRSRSILIRTLSSVQNYPHWAGENRLACKDLITKFIQATSSRLRILVFLVLIQRQREELSIIFIWW